MRPNILAECFPNMKFGAETETTDAESTLTAPKTIDAEKRTPYTQNSGAIKIYCGAKTDEEGSLSWLLEWMGKGRAAKVIDLVSFHTCLRHQVEETRVMERRQPRQVSHDKIEERTRTLNKLK